MLVEGHGRPLAACVSGANTPDSKLLAVTLDAVVVVRPVPTKQTPQHLCLDKGYMPHIRRIGEEKLDPQQQKTYPARRWVVERTFAWLCGCRAILVRYDKRAERYLSLIKLASGLLWFRRWYELDPTRAF